MKNKIQDGKILTLAVASILAGEVVVVGSIIGVSSIATNDLGKVSVHRYGVFGLTAKLLDGETLSVGEKLYYDAAQKRLVKADAGGANLYFGPSLSDVSAVTGDTDVEIEAELKG